MTATHEFAPGGYRFIPGVFPYSGGVAALPGHAIERVRFHAPVPLAEGFAKIRKILAARGQPLTALCACELRSPAPFTEGGFRAFNKVYVGTLAEWGLFENETNPVARSNVCPQIDPPPEPSLHAFAYTVPAADAPPSFVIAGSGEVPEGHKDYFDHIVARGDVGPNGLREKARFVLAEMERRNALNPELGLRLVEAATRAATDPEVRAVLLKGAGGTFCVGGDVKAMAAGAGRDETLDRRFELLRHRMEVSRLLHDMRKPTVAMISGSAAGAGLSMALACDLRIAGKSAKLTTAFAKVGLSGDYGGTYFLTRLVGSAKARELYLTSPILMADEALALGLVTRVVPDAELEAAARELAVSLAQGPSVALGYIKQNINAAERSTIEAVLDTEAMNHVRCTQTEDHHEAAKAFVEKRKAAFKGR